MTLRDEIISFRGTIFSLNVILTMLLVRIPAAREKGTATIIIVKSFLRIQVIAYISTTATIIIVKSFLRIQVIAYISTTDMRRIVSPYFRSVIHMTKT